MTDQKPTPPHYVVSTEISGRGDAFRDEAVARKRFEAIAAEGLLVRLIGVIDGTPNELDRRNSR
jgi:hypothetical protein